MSFFSQGFSSILNERRLKKAAKRGSDRETAGKEEKQDEGRWDRLTDAYGRTYWQHSVTGDWSYGVGGSLVSRIVAVSPSPVVGYPGVVFTSSPVFAPPPPPPATKKDDNKMEGKDENRKEGKDENQAEGKGWWEKKHDEHGVRYWEHTVTKKTTYKDPYY